MASEWQMDSLEDLINVKHGFAFAGEFIHDEPRGDVLLTPGNFAIGGGFKGDKFKYYDGPVLDEFVLRKGDLLVTMTDLSKQADTLGYPAFVPASRDGRRYLHNQRLGKVLLKKPANIDARYLYYVLRGQEYRREVLASATGTTVKHTSPERIRRFRFLRAPLDEQRAISQILGTLDAKIELNWRTNETLEAMACALFKSWFVDFDPVRAKFEGRDPGLPKPVADLFPAHLVDSELGELPEGWRLSKLGTEVETVLGGTPSRVEPAYWDGDIPWINSGKANEFRVVEPSEFITQQGLDSSATKLLPSRTTVIAITGATLGQISLAEIATCANQSIVGVLGSAKLPSEFIYFWTKEHVDDLLAWETGGAQQHINKNNVNDLPVLCPSESAVAAYLAVARPAFDRIKECCNESLALAALRDTLLPKLISGKLRVKDTEKFIGRAAP